MSKAKDEYYVCEYKLRKGNILKDGHTMFLEDVIRDLKRKAYLENYVTELEGKLKVFEEKEEKKKKFKDAVESVGNELLSLSQEDFRELMDKKIKEHEGLEFFGDWDDRGRVKELKEQNKEMLECLYVMSMLKMQDEAKLEKCMCKK